MSRDSPENFKVFTRRLCAKVSGGPCLKDFNPKDFEDLAPMALDAGISLKEAAMWAECLRLTIKNHLLTSDNEELVAGKEELNAEKEMIIAEAADDTKYFNGLVNSLTEERDALTAANKTLTAEKDAAVVENKALIEEKAAFLKGAFEQTQLHIRTINALFDAQEELRAHKRARPNDDA